MTTIPQQIEQLQRELLTTQNLSRIQLLKKMITRLVKDNNRERKKEKKKS